MRLGRITRRFPVICGATLILLAIAAREFYVATDSDRKVIVWGIPNRDGIQAPRSVSSGWDVPYQLPSGAADKLRHNGFVVMGNVEADYLTWAYFGTTVPFITADAVLYVFHGLFRGGLTDYERQHLLPLTERLVASGLDAAKRQKKHTNPMLLDAARRNLIFFYVASSLLGHEVPDDIGKPVRRIVSRIMAACEPGFYPDEDFTTYLPRGVYAGNKDLRRYFRAMRWLSHGVLPILPGKKDSARDADLKLRQALLLGELLATDRSFHACWSQLHDAVSIFMGRPVGFTPLELHTVAEKLGVTTYDEAGLATLRREYAQEKYPEATIIAVPQRLPGDAPAKFVQFMGERFIPDGQIMQETCLPHVAERTVPKGLDVAFCMFDLPPARVHLKDEIRRYPELGNQLTHLQREFGGYGQASDMDTVYSGWVRAIRAAGRAVQGRHLPKAFFTSAWEDRRLNTVLASWTEMRHDFILYAAQPMVPAGVGEGLCPFVEPVPDVYHELANLSDLLAGNRMKGFREFSKLCRSLEKAARAEISGQHWKKMREQDWALDVRSFGDWLVMNFEPAVGDERPLQVVDVAIDSNPPNPVLHEATGPFNLIVLEVPWNPRSFRYCCGWVFSYYEFTRDHFERLTDEQWESMVLHGKHRAYRPEWTRSFLFGR